MPLVLPLPAIQVRRPALVTALLALIAGLLVPSSAVASSRTYVSASWSTTSPSYGQTVRVSGSVSPWQGGFLSRRRVEVLRWDSTYDRWRSLTHAYLSSSAYSLSFTADRIGHAYYFVSVPAGGGADAGHSTIVTITTRRIPSSITAAASRTSTHPGGAVTVSGTITSGTGGTVAGRTVRVYRKLLTGLHQVASSTRSDSSGHWSTPVSTWFLVRGSLVVQAAGTSTTRPASTTTSMSVVPTYTPQGYTSQWAWSASPPQRWNPCRARIGFRVNPGAAGSAFVNEARIAARRLQAAVGIRFVYLGTTSAIPASGRTWPSDTGLVIAWASPGQTRWPIDGSPIAYGGSLRTRWAHDVRGTVSEITTAGVVLDATYGGWRSGFGLANSRGDALQHELGHTVGLGHVGATSQVMYPEITATSRYGAGDLAGFRHAGLLSGCVW